MWANVFVSVIPFKIIITFQPVCPSLTQSYLACWNIVFSLHFF
jgi:hypothetical protein